MGWAGWGLDGVLVEAGLGTPTCKIETTKNQSLAATLTVSDLCEWVYEYLPLKKKKRIRLMSQIETTGSTWTFNKVLLFEF